VTRAEAAALLAVLERRTQYGDPDFASHLFDRQRAYYHDPRRVIPVRAGRRAGKSTAVAPRLLRKIWRRPNTWSLYLALTRKSAKRILLPAVTQVLRERNIGFRVNLTDLEVHLNGGGALLLGGVDTQDQLERYRGLTYEEAAIDECGSFPSLRLKALVVDVLRPALMDHLGCLTMAGSPGYVPAGYWWEISGPHVDGVHHWTCLDNPHLPHAAEEMEEVLRENGWTLESPTFLREWMGLWAEDLGALVYPYDEEKNRALALPTRTPSWIPIDPSRWRYTMGIDVGVVEASAIVVVASHPELPGDYGVHAEKILDMQTHQLAARVRELMARFPGPIVCDTQGIGKAHAEELCSRYGLPVEAATKHEKASAIRILRDRIIAGEVKLLAGSTEELRDEWRVVVWDEQRLNHKRDQDDHCSDAFLYAVRRHRNYRTSFRSQEPEVGSREYYQREEDRLIAGRVRKRHRAPLDS
jgi:hypothetical protein